jgi:hypothetical protein
VQIEIKNVDKILSALERISADIVDSAERLSQAVEKHTEQLEILNAN